MTCQRRKTEKSQSRYLLIVRTVYGSFIERRWAAENQRNSPMATEGNSENEQMVRSLVGSVHFII